MTYNLIDFFNSNEVDISDILFEEFLGTSVKEVLDCIKILDQKPISSCNIPQYSNYENGTSEMIKYLRMSGDYGPSFEEIGEHFLDGGHKTNAYIKYGENHSKLAELLGLVKIVKNGKKRVFLSDLGKKIEKLDENKQEDCFIKLSARIPIVQEAIRLNIATSQEMEKHLNLYLAPVTAVRRRKNTWILVRKVRG